MAKISSKFFQTLRVKVQQKFPVPAVRDRWSREVKEERAAWMRSEALKKIKTMTPTQIKEVAINSIMGQDVNYKLLVDEEKFTPKQTPDTHKATRESLLKRIEKAELLSMAGDDKAALALIAEIVG